MGPFVRRSLEYLVVRLSSQWMRSQPLHLRHLAIIRDTGISGTTAHYVQYSYECFRDLVRQGQAFWEAVIPAEGASGGRSGKKKGKNDDDAIHKVIDAQVTYDEFRFPHIQQPAMQYKSGLVNLEECLKVTKPAPFELASHDPRAIETLSGDYTVQYGLTSASRRKLQSPASTDPPRRSTPSTFPMTDHNEASGKPQRWTNTKPKGRPRKFVSGTEKFWQSQFLKARNLASPLKAKKLGSKAGVMSDPAGVSLFASRPPTFDTTLVRALGNELPVPEAPEDITQDWVDQTLRVLNRSTNGLYVSPKGEQSRDLGNDRPRGQTLIFKSTRLAEVDFSKRQPVPTFRFLSSSAAHSLAYLRYYPMAENRIPIDDDSSSSVDPDEVPEPRMFQEPSDLRGPKLGIFYEDLTPETKSTRNILSTTVRSSRSPQRNRSLSARTSRRGRNPKDKNLEASRIASMDRPQLGVPSGNHAILGTPTEPFVWTTPHGLPPPLTTRAASKRLVGRSPPISSFPSIPTGNRATPRLMPENSKFSLSTNAPLQITASATSSLTSQNRLPPEPDRVPTLHSRPLSHSGNTVEKLDSAKGHHELSLHDNANQSGRGGPPIRIAAVRSDSSSAPVALVAGPVGPSNWPLSSAPPQSDSLALHEQTSEALRLIEQITKENLEARQNPFWSSATVHNDGMSGSAKLTLETLPEVRESDSESERSHAKRRAKRDVTGGSIGMIRRKIVLEIIEECGGAVPYPTISLWNAFAYAWQKTGQAGQPDNRTVKTAVKSLCDNGKIKQMKFSHRNKNGLMVNKAILAKSNLSVVDPVIRRLQQKIIEADPDPYTPPEMSVDQTIRRYRSREGQKLLQPQHQTKIIDTEVTTTHIPAAVLNRKALGAGTGIRPRSQANTKKVVRLETIRTKGSGNPQGATGEYQRPKLSLPILSHGSSALTFGSGDPAISRLNSRTESNQVPLASNFDVEGPSYSQSQSTSWPVLSGSGTGGVVSTRPTSSPGDSRDLDVRAPASAIFASTEISRSRAGKVVWKKPGDRSNFPHSLEDILLDDRRRVKRDHFKELDPDWSLFEWEVDGVLLWELRSFNVFQGKVDGWNFVNHISRRRFDVQPQENVSIIFNGLTWFDQRGKERVHRPVQPPPPSVPHPISSAPLPPSFGIDRLGNLEFHLSGAIHTLHTPPPLEKSDRGSIRPQKRKRGKGKTMPRKRRSKDQEPTFITDHNGVMVDVSGYINSPIKKPRGIQHLRAMPEALIYKLTVAVVVVRTLSGGLDKNIDWGTMMRLFPDEEFAFVRDRWRTLQNKYRRDIASLTLNFQERFCDAYAKGDVPTINFDDLVNTDWEGIVQWALQTLDRPTTNGTEDLPGSREELANTKNIVFEEHRGWRELLGHNVSATIPMREAAQAGIVFAKKLHLGAPSHEALAINGADNDAEQLKVAKSWALSTILTPDEKFNPSVCHEKLSTLSTTPEASEALLERALKELFSGKTITRKKNKSTTFMGRSYDASVRFYESLNARRTVQAPLLRRAAFYKREVLDPAFRRDGRVAFEHTTVEDGDMVALLNLVGNDRIKLRLGDDVPKNRYGVDHEAGYQTRHLEKRKLGFTVVIEAAKGRYIDGNPFEDKIWPVPGSAEGDRAAIPLWIDIHGDLQVDLWELLICAVVGLVSTRPGIDAKELSKTLAPSLTVWEADIVLDWLKRCGFIEKTRNGAGNGWETREWWWLVCGGSTGWSF